MNDTPVHWQASLQNSLGVYLPSILGGLAILLVGWVIALLAAGAFDIDIDQFLTVDNRHAQFFLLRGVE